MSVTIQRVGPADDLAAICTQINPKDWAEDNEMTSYQPDALKKFLANDQNLLLLAYDGEKIAGVALCYSLPHPSGEDTLYVHELDTHPNYRRQGIATQLLQETFKIAKEEGWDEVWLGADQDSLPANALYKSLQPTEIEPSVTYSYKVN